MDMAKTKAIVQSIVKQDAGNDAWQAYFKEAFPWVETAQKIEKQEWVTRLQEEVKRGPIKVTAVHDQQQKIRSRLRTKVVERRTEEVVTDTAASPRLPKAIPVGGRSARHR